MKELAKSSENEAPNSSDKKITSQQFEVLFFEEIKSFKIAAVYFFGTKKANSNYSGFSDLGWDTSIITGFET